MDAEIAYLRLKSIALMEFPDVVISASVPRGHLNVAKSLRLFLTDNSFVEIWISNEKYSYHWQRTDGKIYRHDNAPHKKHKHIATFPKHFHHGSEDNVKESKISNNHEIAIREILAFVRENM